MKILKELPPENYPDIFLDSKTPLYEFISKLTSLINKEQEFIEFISTIKYWYLPKVSLWSFVSILNYIDELLFKYSEETLLTFFKMLFSSEYLVNVPIAPKDAAESWYVIATPPLISVLGNIFEASTS